MIVHRTLKGKVIQGQREKMISREMFLKIDNILETSTPFNIRHKPENIKLPLKAFICM